MLTFTPVTNTRAVANTKKRDTEWGDHLKDVRQEFNNDKELQHLTIKAPAGAMFLYDRENPEVWA